MLDSNDLDIRIYNADCVPGMQELLPDNSIDCVITSIPFAALFSYSHKVEDIGNCHDSDNLMSCQFSVHIRYAFEQLFRVMKPGSLFCCHIQQLLTYKVQHNYMGMRDFRGAIITMARNHGFNPHGEVAILKNPRNIAKRNNLHSLMFVTGARDARALSPAMNDYILFFRKPGESDNQVKGIIETQKEIMLVEPSPIIEYVNGGKIKKVKSDFRTIPYEIVSWDERTNSVVKKTVRGGEGINPNGWFTKEDWIKWAHGCWTDILEIDVLEGNRCARENDEEKHVCLARNSLVLTKDGHKAIQDVQVGDLVLTHKGRWRPVTAKQMTGVNPTIKVYAQGVNGLRLTPTHKLWARNPGNLTHPKKIARKKIPEWIEAQHAMSTYLNLKLPREERDISGLSETEWWLIGRWIADGYLDKRGRAHISCGYGKLETLKEKCGRIFGNPRMNRTAAQIPIYDRGGRIRSILKKCGKRAEGKKLPPEAFTLPQRTAKVLLDGYLSGDGYFLQPRNRWMVRSASKELIFGLQYLVLRAYGVISSIHMGRPAGKTIIESREVNTHQEWNLSFQIGGHGYGFIADDGAWKKVRKVVQDEPGETWSLRVDEDESYTAEGCIVKNCPLQLEPIRRCIKLYTNPDDVVLDPFIGIGSTAVISIEQGRNCVGFELKESYHRMAISNTEKAMESINKQTMFEAMTLWG